MGHLVVSKEPKESILQSFISGSLEGPGKAVGGLWEGAKAAFNIPSVIRDLIADPKARQEMAHAWSTMSPKDRQAVIDGLTEAAGAATGTALGGTAGSVLGPVGTAGGAALGAGGGGMAGRFLSRLVGYYVNPEAFKDSTPQSEARGMGESLTGNATLEGGGRTLGVVAKSAKGVVAPTAEAAVTAAKAKAAGISQTLGVATGRPWIQKTEAMLARHPFSAETIAKAKLKSQGEFESALDRLLGEYHPSEVTPEVFQGAVEKAMGEARSAFQTELGQKSEAAMGRFGRRKTAVQAGEDLQRAHLDNTRMLDEWRNRAYPGVFEQADAAGVSINPAGLGEAADDLLRQAPPDVRDLVLSSKAKRTLRKASDVRPEVNIDSAEAPQNVDVQHLDEGTKPLTLKEAHDLRSSLYQRAKSATNPGDQRIIYSLADAVDQAVEQSMADAPDVLASWRTVNQKFAKGAQATRKVSRANPNGNPMAGRIKASKEPERLVSEVSDNPSRIAQADVATGNSTIPDAVGEGAPRSGPPAMDSVRRVVGDRIVDRSGKGRLSPSRIRDSFLDPKTMERLRALFGGRLDDFVNDMGGAAKREGELYDSKLARTLDSPAPPSSQQVVDSAFPRRNAPASKVSLDLMEDPGVGRRGFGEDLVNKSRTNGFPNRPMGDVVNMHVNPRTLNRKVIEAGETVPAVLGEEGAGKLGDIMEVGQANYAPEILYGNPSGTAHASEMFRLVRDAVNPLKWPKLAASAGLVQGAAKLTTSPGVVEWALKPAVASGTGTFSRGGAVMRALNAAGKVEAPEKKDEGIEEDLAKGIEDDTGIEDDGPAVPAGKLRR